MVTLTEFRNYFEAFGKVQSVLLPANQKKQMLNCGFGFVNFESSQSAQNVLKSKKKHVLRAKEVFLTA